MSELERQIEEMEKNENDFQKLFREIMRIYPGASVGQESAPDPRWIHVSLDGKNFEIEWRPELGFAISMDRTEDPAIYGEGHDVAHLDIQGVMSHIRDQFL